MANSLPSNRALLVTLVIVLPPQITNLLYLSTGENSLNRLWCTSLCGPLLGSWDLESRINLRVKSILLGLGSLISYSGFYNPRQVPELPFSLDSSDRNGMITFKRLGGVVDCNNCSDIVSFVMTIIDCSGGKKL